LFPCFTALSENDNESIASLGDNAIDARNIGYKYSAGSTPGFNDVAVYFPSDTLERASKMKISSLTRKRWIVNYRPPLINQPAHESSFVHFSRGAAARTRVRK